MARSQNSYVCQNCGAVSAKWAGRCEACGEWNTLVLEETAAPGPMTRGSKTRGAPAELVSLAGEETPTQRFDTGSGEFDRVCGGGLVPGSALLIGGEPGIGKSTLLLQICAGLQSGGAVYVSGEEAAAQIQMRARRLGLADRPVQVAAETHLPDILATLRAAKPALVIIDSIQTMWTDAVPAAPGAVTQVRACAHELIRFAKSSGAALIIVGHVTKDGQIAGPRVIEHMVDAVLYFESDPGRNFRILRAVKNRFGPAQEIGVFEMSDAGLKEIANPSELFLSDEGEATSGAAVFAGVEGTRPMLVEFQALVAQSNLSAPRRAVVGWDSSRLAMILAVLDARCGLGLAGCDVFLNVAGGLRISETAADVAAAAALVSSALDAPLPPGCAIFGEISLSGAIRPVGRPDARMREAEKLGFSRVIAPPLPNEAADGFSLETICFKTLHEFVDWMRGAA
ncbi:MAG: DNA repair protein RadA [Pseudomonadota bacterium]